jgi:hypothetical protein
MQNCCLGIILESNACPQIIDGFSPICLEKRVQGHFARTLRDDACSMEDIPFTLSYFTSTDPEMILYGKEPYQSAKRLVNPAWKVFGRQYGWYKSNLYDGLSHQKIF